LPDPDLIIVEGGEVYAPEAMGHANVLVLSGKIRDVGHTVEARAFAAAGLEVEKLDARGCLVLPGIIDVHEHLIGGSGESGGFRTQTPEIFMRELLLGGVTTVVGCLGTDTVTKTMPALLAKVKALREEGLSAHLYTGGYPVPPATLTGSVDRDILFVDEVIGTGELAIADYRSSAPSIEELARVVRQAAVAGMLAGKAGVTHFHVGDENVRLQPLRDLMDHYEIAPETLYPTHVERNEKLFDEAVTLTRSGMTVDVDTMEEDLPRWLARYDNAGADPSRLTASSDAAIMSPGTLLLQLLACCNAGFGVERVFRLTSTNPARVLKLRNKGELRRGFDGDILVVDRASQTVRYLIAKGRVMVREGLPKAEGFLMKSNRRIEVCGQKS
jgi:beta-aspartyl-dipeptidase (metallo-type)